MFINIINKNVCQVIKGMILKKEIKTKKIIINLLITILGVILLIGVFIGIYKNYKKQSKINQEIEDIESEISAIDQKNNELKEMIDYLNSDEFVLERARLNLNFKREGEEVVVIPDKNNKKNEEKTPYSIKPGTNQAKEDSNPIKWFKYFFKI